MSLREHDLIICGGGVAGAALAGLMSQQLRVALVDVRRPEPDLPEDDIDSRVVAVSPGSARILTAAGGWPHLDHQRLAEYQRMQVVSGPSDILFRASDHGLEQLGWIAEIPALQQALWQALEQSGRVSLVAPARIDRVSPGSESGMRVELDSGQLLRAPLVIAADGGRSPLRRQAGIATDEWHYNQQALVAHVRTEQPHDGLAWQRFTEHGPLALLPLADGRCSIVWSQAEARSRALVDMAEPDFLEELNRHADSPMGPALACGPRHALALVRRRARRLVRGRLVLLGDAARTVHPLAGQGLNLGLADAAALAECLANWQPGRCPDAALARYERWRLSASSLIGGGIHAINELAHLSGGIGRGALALGFGAASFLWPARELFVMRACGLDNDSPRLAREPAPT